jgi:hypothetical protein
MKSAAVRQSTNPYRAEVLRWYHIIVKSAFTVAWKSDEDALYVVSEARRLFRQNQNITDLEVIRKKIDEAEMRYGIAVHYLIPYPRPSHKATGSTQSGGIVMRPELDSMFDSDYNPRLGDPRVGTSTVAHMTGGAANGEAPVRMYDSVSGLDDTQEGVTFRDAPERT